MTHTNENKTNIEEPFQQLDMKFIVNKFQILQITGAVIRHRPVL